ncbi:MAG: hypothetical protein CMN32_06790 [Saprospirales bacterium]|nr:hypothetical protein [Saprospirales bacterium]
MTRMYLSTLRKLSLSIAFLFAFALAAQSQIADTTIYKIVDEMPRFPGCEQLDTTLEVKNKCAEQALLIFFNRNIVYPQVARNEEIEGTVVISFVVEPDGHISNPQLIKDIGGGCGEEALRVANAMNGALDQAGLLWKPGLKDGKPVRTQVNLPIRFKIQDPPDFVIVGLDTVYIVFDDSLQFNGGPEALQKVLQENLHYPEAYKDSCFIGTMDMTLRVNPRGIVKVIDLADYSNLGPDFQWEAIMAASATWRQWTPATRNGKAVPAPYDISLTFLPEGPKCQQRISEWEKAVALADEGSRLYNEGQKEEGLAKLTEAIALFPNNANFLYLRGQAYLNMDRKEEACADLQKVNQMVYIEVVRELLPLICK